MRAWTLTSLAILALVWQGQTTSAQSPPAEKAGAPQALTGAGGSDQRTSADAAKKDAPKKDAPKKDAPKKEGGPKEAEPAKPRGRVGTLSPDEQRRADRARKRASATTKTPPVRDAAVERPDQAAVSPQSRERKVSVSRRRSSDETRRAQRNDTRKVFGSNARLDRAARVTQRGRRFVERTWRGPRIGDVVPPGVRLYSLPPGYYGPGPGYATAADLPPYARRLGPPPGFPPYPRYSDEDDVDVDQ